jgi:hypothetical protein
MHVDAPDIADTADPRPLALAALAALHRALLRAIAAAGADAPSDDADLPSTDSPSTDSPASS